MGPLALVVLFITGCLTAEKIGDPLSNDGGRPDGPISDGISSESETADGPVADEPTADGPVSDGPMDDRYLPDACVDRLFYRDTDGDRFGDPSNSIWTCTQPEDYVANNSDCNDANNLVSPEAMEVVDGEDNDCDGITDNDSWTSVSCGYNYCLGVHLDGSVEGWGDSSYGKSTVPPEYAGEIALHASAGFNQSIIVILDGRALVWGSGDAGQATPPDLSERFITDASAGAYHSLALDSDNNGVGWGALDGNHQLDLLDEGLFSQLSAGGTHSCGILLDDGTGICSGNDGDGQVTPPPELAGERLLGICAGLFHSAAIKSDGRYASWGSNSEGQRNIPEELTDEIFLQISCGGYLTAGIKSDGRGVSWGRYTITPELEDVLWRQLDAGWNNVCGVTRINTLECWGEDNQGQTSTRPLF